MLDILRPVGLAKKFSDTNVSSSNHYGRTSWPRLTTYSVSIGLVDTPAVKAAGARGSEIGPPRAEDVVGSFASRASGSAHPSRHTPSIASKPRTYRIRARRTSEQQSKFFVNTMMWLEETGYIKSRGAGQDRKIVLMPKAFEALNATLSALEGKKAKTDEKSVGGTAFISSRMDGVSMAHGSSNLKRISWLVGSSAEL